MGTFVIGFRESFEVAIVMALLLSVLARIGRGHFAEAAWYGLGAGLLVGFSVATGLAAAGITVGGPALAALEWVSFGVMVLAAAGMAAWCARRRQGTAAGEWLCIVIGFMAALPASIQLMAGLRAAPGPLLFTVFPAAIGMMVALILVSAGAAAVSRVRLPRRRAAAPKQLATVRQKVD